MSLFSITLRTLRAAKYQNFIVNASTRAYPVPKIKIKDTLAYSTSSVGDRKRLEDIAPSITEKVVINAHNEWDPLEEVFDSI